MFIFFLCFAGKARGSRGWRLTRRRKPQRRLWRPSKTEKKRTHTLRASWFVRLVSSPTTQVKKRKLTHIKKHSKYFQNKFCIHSITFQAVKIYFKNKLCLIKTTTAKPYYAYGVQGNLALFHSVICNEILNLVNANNPRQRICLLFLASWGELKKMASRKNLKQS